jgi:hypothetical protein
LSAGLAARSTIPEVENSALIVREPRYKPISEVILDLHSVVVFDVERGNPPDEGIVGKESPFQEIYHISLYI